jgi:hypothetical protein
MIAAVIQALAGMAHGGGLVVFAILLNARRAMQHVRDEDVVRVYRAWGAGSGLSLGALIFSSAWLYATTVNPGQGLPDAFALPTDDPLTVARVGLFGALWVSYVVLEIWTLDPCRSLDKGDIVDRAAYAAATNRVARHLAFNAALFCVVVALGAMGARP